MTRKLDPVPVRQSLTQVLLARSAMLRGFKQEAIALGLNPYDIAADAGVELAALNDPDLRVPAEAMVTMYELAAERSGAADFALRVIARRRLSNLGLIALLAREEPTLRQALRSVQRYFWLQNEALDIEFEDVDDCQLLRAVLYIPARRQAVDLCLGMLLLVIRHFLGSAWRPLDVYLPTSAPENLEPYQQLFNLSPQFEHDFVGLLMRPADLNAVIPTADPDLVTQLRRQMEQATNARRTGFIAGVRTLIELRLPRGECDIDQIAAALGLSRRSLQRQLASHSVSFSALVDQTRRATVVSLLRESGRSMDRVADQLGFATASSFNQWFKQRFGCSPTAYRSRSHAADTSNRPPPPG